MFKNKWALGGLMIFTLFFVLSILEIDAWARAGGGRSFGSMGSRSFSTPRSTPAPAPSSPSRQYGTPAQPTSSPFGGGGFLRGMAGGIAGGLLGGMLFRSLGFAGDAGGMGGGIGMMDILLLGQPPPSARAGHLPACTGASGGRGRPPRPPRRCSPAWGSRARRRRTRSRAARRP